MTREDQEWKPLTFDEAYERVRQKLITEEMTYKERLEMLKTETRIMTREEQIKAAAKKTTGLFSYRNGYSTAEDAFIAGAEWADANPCMPDKVIKIPERSREEIKELLANWKGTLVVGNDISPSTWISVEERLPEPEKEVIILNKRKHTDIDFLTDDGEGGYYWWKSEDAIFSENDEITHWMPIPELPKEE